MHRRPRHLTAVTAEARHPATAGDDNADPDTPTTTQSGDAGVGPAGGEAAFEAREAAKARHPASGGRRGSPAVTGAGETARRSERLLEPSESKPDAGTDPA